MAAQRPISDFDWQLTPEPVKQYIQYLESKLFGLQELVQTHEKRIEKLEVRSKQNSANSSKPPSSDSPYTKGKSKKPKSNRAKGGQKGHKGHQRQMLPADKTKNLLPSACSCGQTDFTGRSMRPFYTHQHIEIPVIPIDVTHFVLHQCNCPSCGKTMKAKLPSEASTGYGPRLSAFIAELSGIKGMSRNDVMHLCQSVLAVPVSTGAIQKIIDRASAAIDPFYQHVGRIARSAECNYIDETSWFKDNALNWLWAMVNERTAYYRIDANRSKKAFESLIADWRGVLVSDSYGLYRSWVDGRQTCLAHLIRKADGLSERKNKELKYFGHLIASLLRQLTQFAKQPPSQKQWDAFYRHLLFTLKLYETEKTDAGLLSRQIVRELDCLWTFMTHSGVEPTNNRAERALRFGVLWRKRSFGTQSDKGNRWVERILTFKETCRLKARQTFPELVELIRSYFMGAQPDLAWI
jgi:transposase